MVRGPGPGGAREKLGRGHRLGERVSQCKTWWGDFEKSNAKQFQLVLHVAEELKIRKATIGDFFLTYVHSNCDNVMANPQTLDYKKIKDKEDCKTKEKEGQSKGRPPADVAPNEKDDSDDAIFL
jgi:hypothetical protein